MRKKSIPILSVLILLALTLTSSSYAFYTYKAVEKPVKVGTGKIQVELRFMPDLNCGIPGETVVINEGKDNNTIKKVENTSDYIYMLTYEAVYDESDGTEYITDLMLSDDKTTELGLIKVRDYDMQTHSVTYLGRHTGDGDLALGELLATFDVMKNPSMGKPFSINADITACQTTEAAIKDVFGIDFSDNDIYTGLFN